MIYIWRGLHNKGLVELLSQCWEKRELVILLPIYQKDFSFLRLFDNTQINFVGDWPESILKIAHVQMQLPALSDSRDRLRTAAIGIFTSGTTSGVSRLVFYSRDNVLVSLESIRALYDVQRIQKIFTYPQPTHTFGLVLGYLHSILFQKKLEFFEGPYSRQTHAHWLSIVDKNTLTLGTPTHFIDLIHYVKANKVTPCNSYSAIVGGARTTIELWKQLQNILNIEAPSVGYGATEASPGVTHLPPGEIPLVDGDIGYALSGVKITVNSEEGIYFEGQNACLAIYADGELKNHSQIELRDHLVIDQTGEKPRYQFIGRSDLLVNRGGLKLSLESIEGTLASQLDCKCLALAFYDERLGEDLGVIVQPSHEPIYESSNYESSNNHEMNLKNKVQQILHDVFSIKLNPAHILVADICINANGKFDRKESLKLILKKREWTFPIAIEHLKPFLPHRDSAIWVDTLLESKKHFGVGQVILNGQKKYFSECGRVRESACIEWVAQTYGYTVAINDILNIAVADQGTKMFIAEVKNSEFYFSNVNLQVGDALRIESACTHDFGTLKVVEGKVLHGSQVIAHMSMKLYCGF